MGNKIDLLFVEKIFFWVGLFVALLVALRPSLVLRVLSYGQYKEGDVSSTVIKMVQVIAAVAAITLAVRLFLDFIQRGK